MATSEARTDELGALAQLGVAELHSAVAGIGTIHRSVAGTVFGALRPVLGRVVESPRMVHDAVSEGAYQSMDALLDAADTVTDGLPTTDRPISHTARGAMLLGILNGLIGDELEATRSPLAAPMSIRVGGEPVAVETSALGQAFPDAGGHIVVFLHGLMESEQAWTIGGRPSYGHRLAEHISATEIQVRYNTGRHISDNGHDLADLLTDLVLLWPVPVRRLTLVGHSMGGLVIRSACHQATERGAWWPQLVTETACLGTPHLGAPLERGVHAASSALHSVPATRPISNLLRRRSAGVRDLFHGNLTATDWANQERDSWQHPPGADVPLLRTARHLFVTATITRDPRHPFGRLIGDGLVLAPSGRGEPTRRRLGLRFSDGFELGGAHHFTLLNSDDVYAWLLGQLRPRRALPSA
ncbi:alpha/beta fold hydrolase [Gordonia sp. HNM0687]|uniref:Alpha/beta fold hydrolase n=1 Tax=Gordonia mangrovi TaxID=2665643 RepID=A0A6L7GZG6_9ACTN|nr:alpha/beta hydrolase [Gordonia mangrovi]MXP24275.1 alpha/beta fold hydrolase [Gordonia mangrovi]UVF79906.1 alpha/beta hydrolase [Gordonia mangrovi]